MLEQIKKGFCTSDLHDGDRSLWFTTTGWMMVENCNARLFAARAAD